MSADISWRGLNQQIDALTAELAGYHKDSTKLVSEYEVRVRELESQDEVHWKTRRTLLAELAEARGPARLRNVALVDGLKARVKVLEAALNDLLPGLILDRRYADADDDIDAMNSRIETVTSALGTTSEPPIAQSKSQQKRFEGVVPFAEETKVMHDKCEHGKGLGDHCEPCGDDDDTQTV